MQHLESTLFSSPSAIKELDLRSMPSLMKMAIAGSDFLALSHTTLGEYSEDVLHPCATQPFPGNLVENQVRFSIRIRENSADRRILDDDLTFWI